MKQWIVFLAASFATVLLFLSLQVTDKNKSLIGVSKATVSEKVATLSNKKQLPEANLAKGILPPLKQSDSNSGITFKKEKKIDVEDTPATQDEIMASYINSGNPELVRQKYAERRVARAELLIRKMDEENQNPAWADELTRKYNAMSQMLPGIKPLELESTDCRESICALNLSYHSVNDYKKLEPFILNAGSILGSDSFVHYDATPNSAVLYLSRADASLPQLEFED
ncbi:hypothetical protein [Aliikangiella sp. G2MR2-5]|uniref:hypothetical protein n=1 Tax=Aliikangiella sp. G2MR2-5 TaxID=2788943 RepID=UPI0018A93A0E|nr:hypothetical protein [Aliikangiella sp. G2MR2-5]